MDGSNRKLAMSAQPPDKYNPQDDDFYRLLQDGFTKSPAEEPPTAPPPPPLTVSPDLFAGLTEAGDRWFDRLARVIRLDSYDFIPAVAIVVQAGVAKAAVTSADPSAWKWGIAAGLSGAILGIVVFHRFLRPPPS